METHKTVYRFKKNVQNIYVLKREINFFLYDVIMKFYIKTKNPCAIYFYY